MFLAEKEDFTFKLTRRSTHACKSWKEYRIWYDVADDGSGGGDDEDHDDEDDDNDDGTFRIASNE